MKSTNFGSLSVFLKDRLNQFTCNINCRQSDFFDATEGFVNDKHNTNCSDKYVQKSSQTSS
jgi:hypothetical protein